MAQSAHPMLAWPRTDASKSNWPAVGDGPPADDPMGGWNTQLGPDHNRHILYRNRLGDHLAQKMGITGLGKSAWISLPPGYGLFGYKKRQADGTTIREDIYLHGSSNVLKFRSASEFIPHADWLMDTSKPLDDHTTCECLYAKKGGRSAGAPKRPAGDRPESSKKSKQSHEDEEGQAAMDTIVPERAIDRRTQRRFRRGELIFFRIPTIDAPEGSDLPPITHWPGLIASIADKSANGEKSPSVDREWAAASWMLNGATGQAARAPADKSSMSQTFTHSIRPLGMFNKRFEVTRETSEILPWSASAELLGNSKGWDKIGLQSTRALQEGLGKEVETDPPKAEDLVGKALADRWRKGMGALIKFDDMPRNWYEVVLRLGMAIRQAKMIGDSFAPTDKIEVVPPGSVISDEDLVDIESRKMTLYQGLWYQGERIWQQDLVRLRKKISDLPEESLAPPGRGADQHAVFLKVRLISIEPFEAIDDTTATGKGEFRCILYGDLFSLACEDAGENGEEAEASTDENRKLHYRQLNGPNCEIKVDLFDVAGRCYPDLLDGDDAYFYLPSSENDVRPNRQVASDTITGLTGMRPTQSVIKHCVWKEDLYVTVRDAVNEVEEQTRAHYAKSLAGRLRLTLPPPVNGSAQEK